LGSIWARLSFTSWRQLAAVQVRLDAVYRQPAEAEAAAHGIHCRLDGVHRQRALRRNPWLAPWFPRGNALDDHRKVLNQIEARPTPVSQLQRMIETRHGLHSDVEHRFDEVLARGQSGDAEVGVMVRNSVTNERNVPWRIVGWTQG